ncbi:MAG: hypothetical protein HYZ89_03080 [Candidatus Omnitrophica bacterium]|nr:hypothetical protein [Candidatus Omnitrophota bacterium]
MREVAFLRWLTDTCRIRHRHWQRKGGVVRFAVQLEVLLHGQWEVVRRYDTAHGFAHCDILHPDGRVEKLPLAFHDYNAALTCAETELRAHWQLEAKRYLEEARRHD